MKTVDAGWSRWGLRNPANGWVAETLDTAVEVQLIRRAETGFRNGDWKYPLEPASSDGCAWKLTKHKRSELGRG